MGGGVLNMPMLRYLIPVLLLSLVIILVHYYTKPLFTMTPTMSSNTPPANSSTNYGESFTIAVGETKQFPDFSLEYVKQEKESMGQVAGGPERFRTNYFFKVVTGDTVQETAWHYGFPGGLGPTLFTINQQGFALDGSVDLTKVGGAWVITKVVK